MFKLFEINQEIIRKMARGEKTNICPITGNEKDLYQWVSRGAYERFGYKAVRAVKMAVEREKNRLPKKIFKNIKEVARKLFKNGDARNDREIAISLIGTILPEDTSLKGVENAVRAARREHKKKREI